MLNKKFMVLTILLVSLLAISAVSAADNAAEDVIADASNDLVSAEDNIQATEQTENEEAIGATDDGTFTELQNMIDKSNNGSTVVLDRDYNYDDSFSTKGITVNKTLTIDGKGHTLNALSKSQILHVEASDVVLKNINFINGYTDGEGGAVQWEGANGKLTDCYFENNYAGWGGAVSWFGNGGTMSRCTFEKNSAFMCGAVSVDGSYFAMTNSTFRDNHAMGGGAVVWSGSNGAMYDSAFTGNVAEFMDDSLSASNDDLLSLPVCEDVLGGAPGLGGAIVWWGKNSTVNSCRFTDNSVISNDPNSCGGAVFVNIDEDAPKTVFANCTFENNHADFSGGAFYGRGNCSVEYSRFINNDAGKCGGAVYCDGCDVLINGNTFSDNSAESGGAIATGTKDEDLIIIFNVFRNNKAKYGGAIHLRVKTLIDDCIFNKNTADYGGAVYQGNDQLEISYSNFTDNFANNTGGALNAGGTLYVGNSIFGNNAANGKGGAIISYGYAGIYYSDFINNTASKGGAVYLDGISYFGPEMEARIDNSKFSDNSALEWGGAVFNERDLTVFSSEFDRNSAQYGGAVSSYNGYVNELILINNKVIEQDYRIILRGENIFKNNSAFSGGAIFIGFDEVAFADYKKYGRLEIYGDAYSLSSTDILKGSGPFVPLGSSRFYNNDALLGGAIYVIHTDANVQNAEFVGNTAGIAGAILSQGYSTLNITISGFTDNSAFENGSTLFAQNNLWVYNSNFANSLNQELIYYSNLSDINSGTLHLVANSMKTPNVYAIVYESASRISSPTSLILESQNVLKGSTFKIGKLVDDMGNVIVGPDILIILYKNNDASLKMGNSDVLGGDFTAGDYQFVLKSNYTIGGYNFKCDLDEGVYEVSGSVLNVGMDEFKCSDCVLSVSDLIFKAPSVVKYFGGSEKFTVKLADNKGKAIGGHEVSITINGRTYNLKTDSNGIAEVSLDLPVGFYDVTALSGGIKVLSNVTVLSTVSVSDVTGSYLNSKAGATFKNVDGSHLANAKVTFKINGADYAATTNTKGVATADVDLGVGTYTVTAINPVNSEQKQFKLVIGKASSAIALASSQINGITTMTATLTPAAATGSVIFNVNGEDKTAAVKNGKATLTLSDLEPGDYAVTASYSGDKNLNASASNTVIFNVAEVYPILTADPVTKTYGTSTKLVVNLVDSKGNAIANADVSVVIGSATKHIKTDSNGLATMTISLKPATYTANITYLDAQTTAKINVKKATPKLTAKAKTFKKSLKTKKYTITLKTNTNKVMINTKVTLKVNGKTYKATTNSKGKATFKITKLTKKGKFNAVIKFAGNSYYKMVTKTIRITVKK